MFSDIQAFVNHLNLYCGVKVPKCSANDRNKRAMACAYVLEFTKTKLKNSSQLSILAKTFLPDYQVMTFGHYMALMYGMFSPLVHPVDQKDLRENYKKGKSALQSNRFSPATSALLQRVMNDIVEANI